MRAAAITRNASAMLEHRRWVARRRLTTRGARELALKFTSSEMLWDASTHVLAAYLLHLLAVDVDVSASFRIGECRSCGAETSRGGELLTEYNSIQCDPNQVAQANTSRAGALEMCASLAYTRSKRDGGCVVFVVLAALTLTPPSSMLHVVGKTAGSVHKNGT